jgi:hypothetical protein
MAGAGQPVASSSARPCAATSGISSSVQVRGHGIEHLGLAR